MKRKYTKRTPDEPKQVRISPELSRMMREVKDRTHQSFQGQVELALRQWLGGQMTADA